jgi:hypothetical protein
MEISKQWIINRHGSLDLMVQTTYREYYLYLLGSFEQISSKEALSYIQ